MSETDKTNRRHDLDWLRVIALSILIVYHIAVAFQPWGTYIFFITNEDHLQDLWTLMQIVNIWRIPILFTISGMGVYFAMQRRNWKQLIKDRTVRILTPLIFGSVVIVPISFIIFFNYYNRPVPDWISNPGHLWFLGNIFFYVLVLLPVFNYFNNRPNNIFFKLVSDVVRKPFGIIFIFALPVVTEAVLINPKDYPLFVSSLHGLIIGLVCFFSGFVLVSLKEDYWSAVKKAKFITLVIGLSLYIIRIFYADIYPSHTLMNLFVSFESANWMLSAFGLAASYLNKPSRWLAYLSSAVYPAYIVHLPVQQFFSSVIFPLSIPASVKFVTLVVTTFGGSLVIFEILKRLKWIRFLFGMKSFQK